MSPECVIFDESTAMLDPKGRKDVLAILDSMRKDLGITVLLITHYMDEAVLADRVIVMDDGKIVADGSPRAIFSQKELLESRGLEVPQSTALVRALYDAGLCPQMTALEPDEAARCITAMLEEANKTRGQ